MWHFAALALSLLTADSTVLKGTVLSLGSGHPLAGVTVSRPGRAPVTTDSAGHFAIPGPAARLHLTWNGVSGTGVIPAGAEDQSLLVVIDTGAADLSPTIEHEDWHLAGHWGMPGFFGRARQGYGTFFTRDALVRSGFTNLKDLLSSLGIHHGCLRDGGGCGAVIYYRNVPTLVSIYVDGAFQNTEQADDRSLGDVTGIEYYPLPNPPRPALASPREWIVKTNYLEQLPLQEFTVVLWTRDFYQRLAER